MIEAGIKGHLTQTVGEAHTALAMGSGGLRVFATPAMVALMEATALQSVQPLLPEGQGTVGTALDVRHMAATPVGMAVRCESALTAVDRRKLTFFIAVHDEKECIGTATHERFIVDNERFIQKAEAKHAP